MITSEKSLTFMIFSPSGNVYDCILIICISPAIVLSKSEMFLLFSEHRTKDANRLFEFSEIVKNTPPPDKMRHVGCLTMMFSNYFDKENKL